ncbi:MAG: hypothetical protein A3K23_05750 [Desulfobacca sp. RBG_16_58_9]|nr:MAG: hypothetical protein A3K23_05750 [Desulfobacca sp. RBG_16_58_9]
MRRQQGDVQASGRAGFGGRTGGQVRHVRRGDWEIIGVGDRKLRRRGPISHQELDCDRFCTVATEAAGIAWPHQQ